MGYKIKEEAEEIRAFGAKFKRSTTFNMKYKVNKRDLEGNLNAIKDAKRMADFVIS